ncbi:hypothetical protein [Mesorhizobium sp.]|uniref:hypothetical protein n=1 Tax=Mesorhizobium sp. TaxID=1871066 RepID=UPI000FE6207F|nr:hypothetical protein [Mesorhizobium sp.]RWE95742.1 MAG: hypothetical protein EOS68_18805 [Mesorhizobium sp.]
MIAPVLPVAREDGYYLVSPDGVRFVPLDPARRRPTGKLIPFPQFFRATQRAVGAMIEAALDTPAEKIRFVSRRADQLDAILDEIDGYRGEG